MNIAQISVVVPLYNKELYVERAITSILNQTFQDFEIIVVNDGSTDNSAKVVMNIRDSRISLIQQENGGVSKARNTGIQKSKSELIAFLDADDEWMPGFLEKILKLRNKYPSAGIYAMSMKNEYIDSILVTHPELKDLVPEEDLLANYFKVYKKGIGIFCASSVAIPRNILLEYSGFKVGFWWGEDVDLWGRIALKYPIAYSSLVGAFYRQEVMNSAVKKREVVKIHPFVLSANEAIINNKVPINFLADVKEYIQFLDFYTAKHNIYSGDRSLAYKFLRKKENKNNYKKELVRVILSTHIKEKSPTLGKVLSPLFSRSRK
ncbi:hypothetical protein DU48_06245 [Methanosarcina mazei]|uniref:Glycosyltransferase 2-like domain-containing protein n=1 Tax=Methanosarcina mazei TaxID=2209 RepID=A0A0F8P494_METMZ|nr:hypothetical protein DU44_06275 [Methanosarcina mazei]KKH17776.1 hypothetical protein DU48_06245 [Methanosarcina mazei]KKH24986.1 hypothetical protein DU65_05935 [Methanosarcina mazei]